MKIRYLKHLDQSHPKLAGSYLLTAVAYIHGAHQATGVFVHEKFTIDEAKKQIKLAFRNLRNGTHKLRPIAPKEKKA